MLYLIGLGLNENAISLEGREVLSKCKKIYLEGYTVDFPYSKEKLEKTLGVKTGIETLGRDKVESDFLIKEAKAQDIALLIYGSPLFATTHMTLINDCKKEKINVRVIFAASVFDALGQTGLELYKFGKITSMPKWIERKFEPDSFMDIVHENSSIKAHSLILCDIGLELSKALEQLEISAGNKKMKLGKIVLCSSLGTSESKIFYNTFENLKKLKGKIKNPFCIIIPSELHFMEKEALEKL